MGFHLNFNYYTGLWEVRDDEEKVLFSGHFEECENEVEKLVGRL